MKYTYKISKVKISGDLMVFGKIEEEFKEFLESRRKYNEFIKNKKLEIKLNYNLF